MTWALQDAKAKLSEVVRLALTEGPQHVTVRGQPALVLISEAEYAALLNHRRRKPLAEVLRASPVAGAPLDLTRSRDAGRKVKL
jgi:prevent-host-death family protein